MKEKIYIKRTEILLRDFFFLVLSTKMTMSPKDTKHHLEEIKKNYDKNENIIENYSPIIRNCFFTYLHFLQIIKTFKND